MASALYGGKTSPIYTSDLSESALTPGSRRRQRTGGGHGERAEPKQRSLTLNMLNDWVFFVSYQNAHQKRFEKQPNMYVF